MMYPWPSSRRRFSNDTTGSLKTAAARSPEPSSCDGLRVPEASARRGDARRARDLPLGAAILGASSAGEFAESGDAKGAVSVVVLDDVRVHTGFSAGLKADPEAAVARALEGLPRTVDGFPHCTAILLLDALSGVGEEAALLVSTELGPDVKLAGGAAGDDLAMTKTFVAAGDRVEHDALAIALVLLEGAPRRGREPRAPARHRADDRDRRGGRAGEDD